jgi:hypothetical protein
MPENKEEIAIRKDAILTISPLETKANAIVIKSWDDYTAADQVLINIKEARKSPIFDRLNGLIKPLKEAVDAYYKLRREIEEPLDKAETSIKGKMRQWQIEDAEVKAKAERERQAAIAKAEEEARIAQEKLKKAVTKPMMNKLAESKARLDQKRAELESQKTAPAPKAAGSAPRKMKKWRVVSMAKFVLSLVEAPVIMKTARVVDSLLGYTPVVFKAEAEGGLGLMSLLTIDKAQMDAKFSLDQPEIGEWMPGVECYEDITIAGKRS